MPSFTPKIQHIPKGRLHADIWLKSGVKFGSEPSPTKKILCITPEPGRFARSIPNAIGSSRSGSNFFSDCKINQHAGNRQHDNCSEINTAVHESAAFGRSSKELGKTSTLHEADDTVH